MIKTITYGVDVSWSELVDFIDERYLELLCERLRVKREYVGHVPFIMSERGNALFFFNVVEEKHNA